MSNFPNEHFVEAFINGKRIAFDMLDGIRIKKINC